MAKTIEIAGVLTVQDDCTLNGIGSCAKPITLGPGMCSRRQSFPVVVSGQYRVDSPEFSAFGMLPEMLAIQLLYLRSTSGITVRLYAEPAVVRAVLGAYPSGFSGGETLVTVVDGISVTTTFDAADQTAIQCAARINSAFAFQGFTAPRASVESGQIVIRGENTAIGSAGSGQIVVTTTAGATRLGLATGTNPESSDAKGKDFDTVGLAIMEFPGYGENLLRQIEVKGNATIDLLVAGK